MLTIQSLSAAYGQRTVLHDLSLEIHRGEILAVIGPNGAGKSTLIRAVSGVLPIQSGRVLVDGRDLTRLNPMQRARCLAVVPQGHELPGAYTAHQTVLLGRTPYLSWLGKAGESDRRIVKQAMDHTHTRELAERRVSELSGGERQRVLLARAIAQSAPILLLDEPTTHLDLEHQSSLLNLVRAMVDEKDLAVLMVVHDLNLAGLYADRVALLVEGCLQAQGSPEAVLTPENLSPVYKVPVNVIPHPDYGTPLVLPDGREPRTIPRPNLTTR
jgi:iron complex transport system ATP-binding protein